MSKKDKKKKKTKKEYTDTNKKKKSKKKDNKKSKKSKKRTVEIRNCILEEMQWNILSQIHLIMMMTYILGIR